MNQGICVIGGGRWGQNHIRTLHQMGNLAGIVESNPARLKELLLKYPVPGFTRVDEALQQKFAGFVLATPAATHYTIGKNLLQQGCHTLIEKPLALCSKDSQELLELAEQNGARLMVGHILLFHPAIRKIKEIIDRGTIGQLYYLYATRLNFGTVRTEENVFWSFAPHDIAVFDFLTGQTTSAIQARGGRYLQDKIDDIVIAQFIYPNQIQAHIFVSWLHPFKEQRLVVVGSKGMVSFDDSTPDKAILLSRKRIDWQAGVPVKMEEPDEIVPYEKSEPLRNELQYFIEHLDQRIEIANGRSGHEVVRVLEKAQQFLER